MSIFLISLLIFLSSLVGSYLYQSFAFKNKILALINFRTLHSKETPKGGGIVLSSVFSLSVLVLIYINLLNDNLLLIICSGALISSFFGYYDDLFDIRAVIKILVHGIMALSILISILSLDYFLSNPYGLIYLFFLSFFFVWVINSINFMDGIDGLCSSLTICILLIASVGTFINGLDTSSYLPFLMVSSVCSGFLIINLSEKKLFMGDSGTLFLGFMLCSFALRSVSEGELTFWFWGILFSFCLTETTSTTLYRLFKVKKWYGAHRSHAYQNLARVLDNHKLVTGGVVLYHFCWIAPLSIFSILFPNLSLFFLILAILPVLVFNLYYGPRFSIS